MDSIPGLLAPVEKKNKVTTLFTVDFVSIFVAYILLAYSAVFAYDQYPIPSTYTTFFRGKSTSFLRSFIAAHVCTVPCAHGPPQNLLRGAANEVVAIILALYPVFTLTTNFPLICITLRNNIIRFMPDRGTLVSFFLLLHFCGLSDRSCRAYRGRRVGVGEPGEASAEHRHRPHPGDHNRLRHLRRVSAGLHHGLLPRSWHHVLHPHRARLLRATVHTHTHTHSHPSSSNDKGTHTCRACVVSCVCREDE